MRMSFLFVLVLMLVGCASTGTPYDANAFMQLKQAQMLSQSQQINLLADTTHCRDDACVIAVKALAAMAQSGSGTNNSIPAPQRQLSPAEQFATVLGAVTPLAQLGQGVYLAREGRRTAEVNNRMIAGIANAPWEALPGVLAAMPSGPQTVVHGNLGDTINTTTTTTSTSGDTISVGGNYGDTTTTTTTVGGNLGDTSVGGNYGDTNVGGNYGDTTTTTATTTTTIDNSDNSTRNLLMDLRRSWTDSFNDNSDRRIYYAPPGMEVPDPDPGNGDNGGGDPPAPFVPDPASCNLLFGPLPPWC